MTTLKKDSRFLLEKKSWISMFQYDPMTLKAASDYRAERARKDCTAPKKLDTK
jgi:hypothetical protein